MIPVYKLIHSSSVLISKVIIASFIGLDFMYQIRKVLNNGITMWAQHYVAKVESYNWNLDLIKYSAEPTSFDSIAVVLNIYLFCNNIKLLVCSSLLI